MNAYAMTEATAADQQTNLVTIALEARECEWIFAPSESVSAWGFNGVVPGPVIEATVGDTIVVRLKNSLSEPTTIHWHGIRLESQMDGTESTQTPVQPGETFEYRFTAPDAGTFWYHSHANETVQVERGLYGALIVHEREPLSFDRDRLLVLDDLRLDRKGRIAPPGGWIERHNGREGSVLLINGVAEPTLSMRAGQVERWRIVNAASARYVRLSIGGRPFRIIATDGGLIERPVWSEDVLLAPGDRVELAVGPFEDGELIAVESLAYNRGLGAGKTEHRATLTVGPPSPSITEIPEQLRRIEPLVHGPSVANREIRLSGKMSLRRGTDFFINDEQHFHDKPVRVGELQIWDVVNESRIDHPFHLHGFFFQVVETNGVAPEFMLWEDTVNVPANGRVRIAWMPDDRPGTWMYHCHILEHHAAGMMAHFDVIDAISQATTSTMSHCAHG